MSIEAYDLLKVWANPEEFSGWHEIEIKPPIKIHVLIYILNWGAAIGMLLEDNMTFRCSLPHEDSHTCLEISRHNVTHWAVIPDIKEKLKEPE